MQYKKRTTYIENDNYKLSLEEVEDCLFVHCEIKHPSKSALIELKADWAELLIQLYFFGYEEVFTYTRDMRLPNLVGGGSVVGSWDDWRVVKWDLS
jgi:hypothetical protein